MKLARLLSTGCVALVLGMAAAPAISAYPDKPIRIVYPFPPGGSDSTARLFAERLSQSLKTPVIIENRGGAGGNIGAEMVARAPADGYTLLIGTNGPLSVNPSIYRDMPFDPQKDFVPITGLVSAPQVMFVRPSLPVKTVQDLIAYSRAHPSALSYGSVGQGSVSHLTMELFKSLTGAKIMHVPYQGAGPAITAVLGGHIAMMTVTAGSVMPYVNAGTVRALAITGAKPSKLVPGVSTLVQLGIPLEANAWLALVAPARTPEDIVEKLNTASKAILQDPVFISKIAAMGYEPAYTSPGDLARMMARERQMWAKVVKDTGTSIH